MSIVVALPYDPTASQAVCRIVNERHSIVTFDNTYRVIIPEMAPFFRKDLKVIHAPSNYELREGHDYYLGFRIVEAAAIAAEPLFGAIVITNKNLLNEFVLDYRSVGGPFVGIRSEVLTYLANYLVDPVKTPFERVIDRPEYFTPHEHEMHYADFVNKGGVADALEALLADINAAHERKAEVAVGDLEDRLATLTSLLNSYNYAAHMLAANPHNTTFGQLGALGATQDAVDSFLAYGMTLTALAQYINSRGITRADVDKYLRKKTDQTVEDELAVTGTVTSSSGKATLSINQTNGQITLSAEELAEFVSDGAASNSGGSLYTRLVAGANVLEVRSKGSSVTDDLYYNGHKVFHHRNIEAALAGQAVQSSRLLIGDTESIDLSGAGWENAPLTANAQFVVGSLTRPGVLQLTNSTNSTSTVIAATPAAVRSLRNMIDGYALNTRRINDMLIRNNPTLTPTHVNLGSVNNTNDLEKPISTPQQQLLDQYADGNHRHPFSLFGVPQATESVSGIMALLTDPEGYFEGATAITPKLVSDMETRLAQFGGDMSTLLPSAVMNIGYWDPGSTITYSDFSITMPEFARLYLNRVDFSLDLTRTIPAQTLDLAALFPTNHTNRDFHIHIRMLMDGTVEYFADTVVQGNTSRQLYLFSVRTGTTTFATVSKYRYAQVDVNVGELYVDPITSVGMFRELLDHIDSQTPHFGGDLGGSAALGLSAVQNYPLEEAMFSLSPYALSSWRRQVSEQRDVLFSTITDGVVPSGVQVSATLPADGKVVLVGDVGFTDPQRVGSGGKRRAQYVISANVSNTASAMLRDLEVVLGEGGEGATYQKLSVLFRPGLQNASQGEVWLNHGQAGATLLFSRTATGTLTTPPELTLDVSYEPRGAVSVFVVRLGRKRSGSEVRDYTQFYLSYENGTLEVIFSREVKSSTGSSIATSVMDTVTRDLTQAVRSGAFGLGFHTTGPAGGYTFTAKVDAAQLEERGGETRYVSAKAVYDALKAGSNLIVLSGTTTGPLPIPYNCHSGIVMYDIVDYTTPGDGVLDWIDGTSVTVRSFVGNAPLTLPQFGNQEDDRQMLINPLYKQERDGGAGAITRQAVASYLIIGFRQT